MVPVVITGGYGFIGSNAVNYFCDNGHEVTIVDKMTYAAYAKKVKHIIPDRRVHVADVGDVPWVKLLREHGTRVIVNFAAETHVDNSIADGSAFMRSNCLAVQHMLSELNAYYEKYGEKIYLLHISTDEVYGDVDYESQYMFCEQDPLRPNNPYSAAKASADLLIQAYHHTYRSFDYTILRSCNNFGPGQHHEKFLPTIIRQVMQKKRIPVYGQGKNIREWIYVEDFVRIVRLFVGLWGEGQCPVGEIFNVSSGYGMTNLELIGRVLYAMDIPYAAHEPFIELVPDRKGHDRKYALSAWKLHKALGVSVSYDAPSFLCLLRRTVEDIRTRYCA